MKKNEMIRKLIETREEYINLIRAELLGPGSEFDLPDAEHELISSSPMSRYSVGILYPQGNKINQDNDEIFSLREENEISSYEVFETINYQEEKNELESKKERYYEFDETANENLDEEISLASQYLPSSMGITFIVKGMSDKVNGIVSFATYRKATFSDCIIPFYPDDPYTYSVPKELAHKMIFDKESKVLRLISPIDASELKDIFESDTISENESEKLKRIAYKFVDYLRNGYVREPHTIEFTLDFNQSNYIDNNKDLDGTSAKITALRTKLSDNLWSLTIMLVNDYVESPAQATNCLYQPVIKITTEKNDFTFEEIKVNYNTGILDEEECSLELLYRHKKVYATGLGVSVDWDIDDSGKGSIWSDFFPIKEVPQMDFSLPRDSDFDEKKLSMKYLSDLDSSDKIEKLSVLQKLVDLYKNWVDNLEKEAETLDINYKEAATRNIKECKRAYNRMYSGIETLRENDLAYNAFMLANRAMFMQRVHLRLQAKTADEERYPDDIHIASLLNNMDYRNEEDDDCIWRPFQIAFLLMDINSIIDETVPERDIIDLIWFPTGGGKTEAYLGLTAFAIFYRRLKYSNEYGGTAVIMRYTLRLLAAQQFTRAATLICACEYIRRDCESKQPIYSPYNLGKEPITIGLWIGGTHTPNKNADASACLKKLNDADCNTLRYVKERYNKFQVLKCPWCGTKLVKDIKNNKLIGKWGYSMENNKHFYMFCPQEQCEFTDRLPIQIVDDELYRKPPTLLFATVDKFAMLPWDGRIGTFFAVASSNRTPELIIQDELHLISGALGTIVGLYETAIDAICSRKGVKPKIIASTATIRKAKEQCSVLYNRDVIQFPSPGLNSNDSFFAREAEIDYEKGKYGRVYVGIMPSGKTKAMTEVRIMAALLQRVHMMDLPDEIKDKLWTLTTYFNSLKDLGKASTLVEDDVKDFIIRIANRLLTLRRIIKSADELTSRITTSELNETLYKLEKIEYSKKNYEDKRYCSNVLLATNMISVGIDVARLNVMLMVGQPKLTSEYIQASSRVGRSFPGVVFVQYDASKSRDRSHYEQFRSYHESLYRFVEPTGATPFSKPARDRALHAVLLSIIRQNACLLEDKDAYDFDKNYHSQVISNAIDFIYNRIYNINKRSNNIAFYDIEDAKAEMELFIDTWQKKVDLCNDEDIQLFFGRKFMVSPPDEKSKRLIKPFHSLEKDNSIKTLTSMRNVDTSVCGRIIIVKE